MGITTSRGGVEDTRLEAKAKVKDTKKIRGQGQGQPFRGQTLSRPRTGMLEAKDLGHKRKCSPKKKGLRKNFSGDLQKKKKGLHKNFSGDLHKKRFPKNFSSAPQNLNNSKNSAVLEPRTGQFSRTWGFEAKAEDFKMCPRGRPRGLHLWLLAINSERGNGQFLDLDFISLGSMQNVHWLWISTFSDTNLMGELNVFFLLKFLSIIRVFKYCIATMILLSKSIAKYCKFIFLKWNKVPYLQAQILAKNWVFGKRTKCQCLRWTILVFFGKIAFFVTFVGGYIIRFSENFEKRKYCKS